LVAASVFSQGNVVKLKTGEIMPEETITEQETTTESTTATAPSETTVDSTTSSSASTPEVKETPVDPSKMKSLDIAELIKKSNEPKPEAPREDEWFDKERGFKTKEDFIKSYTEAQNAIREKSEQLKKFEEFKSQAEVQLKELSEKAEKAPLSPEDAQKQEALKKWQQENKESLDFIANLVEEKVKSKQVKDQVESSAVKERNDWKQEFDKDEARKSLWPKMEEIYAKEGGQIFQKFMQNPFPFLEAVAFKENFSVIAEKIKQEAIEKYKLDQKQAAEVARNKSTATPGGLKIQAGETDVSKMSSADLAALLPRGE
jgi:hypothetical protein